MVSYSIHLPAICLNCGFNMFCPAEFVAFIWYCKYTQEIDHFSVCDTAQPIPAVFSVGEITAICQVRGSMQLQLDKLQNPKSDLEKVICLNGPPKRFHSVISGKENISRSTCVRAIVTLTICPN